VLKGRFGPYLKIGKDNFKIPKTAVPEDLSLEECIALSEVKPEKKAKGTAKRKK
jgi:DNA topoisomerase-1